MKVLITGGLGYIGAILTRHLIQCGYVVYTLSHRDRDVLIDEPLNKLFADISKGESIRDLVRLHEFDAVVHLASVNDTSLKNFSRIALDVNAYGTVSGCVSERTDACPINDYGTTHLFGEYYVKQFFHTDGIPFTILRLTNGYGCPLERNSTKWSLVLNDFCRMASRDRVIRLNSNGTQKRDFVWLGDVAQAVRSCIDKGPANDVFNLAGNHTMSIREVAELVRNACSASLGFNAPVIVNENDKYSRNDTISVSIEKLQNWIYYNPRDNMVLEATRILEFSRSIDPC